MRKRNLFDIMGQKLFDKKKEFKRDSLTHIIKVSSTT